jgi:putative thioredoxin
MSLFGISQPKKEAPPIEANATIFDVGTPEFEERVIKPSMEKPVLVDFWAPWCGPCKQLMPVLEAEVSTAGGDVLLAKVNIDDHPELAQALRIQSVPTVMAFFQGQPVTGFTGARPASEIKKLIAQLVKLARSSMPDALDIPASLKQAAEFVATGDTQNAQALYIQILQQDQTNVEAYNGMVRVLISIGAIEEAAQYVEQAPEAIAKSPNFSSSKTALDIALKSKEMAGALAPLEKKLAASPDDLSIRYELAQAQFAAGQKGEAIDNFLEIVRRDRNWNDEAARKELLRCFEALGFADPFSVDGRKKLSRILFS